MDRAPFIDQFVIAQIGSIVAALAFLAAYPARPRIVSILFAIALTLLAFVPSRTSSNVAFALLGASALLPTLAVATSRVGRLTWLAAQGQVVLAALCGWLRDFLPALAQAHFIWICLLIGLERYRRTRGTADEPLERAPPSSHALEDLVIFALATGAAAVTSTVVLERYILSGDEWANTFQADVYGHLMAYAPARECAGAFHNWWVMVHQGRAFAQYTPGWPLVMAPFERAGVVWLATPVTFGAMAVGVARLSRRAALAGLLGVEAMKPRLVTVAGVAAAILVTAAPSMLLNGASRYPHTMVCACFAWSVESLAASCNPMAPSRSRALWGLVFGTAVGLLLAARPMDGVTLGTGLAVYAVWAWMRRRLTLATVLLAGSALAAWGGLAMVLLRLQLGSWFKTGYSLSAELPIAFSAPRLDELAYAFKFDKGTGYWWPCSLGLAAIGLLALRRFGRGVGAMLALSLFAHSIAYAFVANGRDAFDSGYGPRYNLPVVIGLAVGGGLFVALLWAKIDAGTADRRLLRSLPLVAVALAYVVGVWRIGEWVYPAWHKDLHAKRALQRAIATSDLRHAVVFVREAELAMQAWDETQNLYSEPDPDVLIVTDHRAGEDFECARRRYADRAWYRAKGWDDVTITPY